MTIDPRRLLMLRAVRRAGGVQAAARVLHLTPSGISQHIAKLEAEVGLPLVDRSRRGGGRSLDLTPIGQRLADGAEKLAETLAEVERDLDEFRPTVSGPLRIGGFAVAITELVAPVTIRMAVIDPAFEPVIHEVTEADGLAALAAGELDLLMSERGCPGDPVRSAGITEVDLLPDPYRVIVPASWPVITDPAELFARPWVTTSYCGLCRRALENICRRYDVTIKAHDIGTGSAATLLSLVANGLGAAVIPGLTLSQNPSPNVRPSDGVIDAGSRIISVLRPSSGTTGAAARFIAELREFAATRESDLPAPAEPPPPVLDF